MIDLTDIIRQMTANAEAMHALLQSVSDEQAQWKPDPETWCLKETMEHVFKEERIDFRSHLKEMFHEPPLPWGEFRQEEVVPVESCQQALDQFLAERATSIAWLKGLVSPDWEVAARTPFGPAGGVLVLKAGDVLASWVAHDYLHLRQLNELLYAWNEHQAAPYSLQYAGGW